jgi:hypothetical protein
MGLLLENFDTPALFSSLPKCLAVSSAKNANE